RGAYYRHACCRPESPRHRLQQLRTSAQPATMQEDFGFTIHDADVIGFEHACIDGLINAVSGGSPCNSRRYSYAQSRPLDSVTHKVHNSRASAGAPRILNLLLM